MLTIRQPDNRTASAAGDNIVISDLHQIDDAQKQAILTFILDSKLDDFVRQSSSGALRLMDLLAVAATGPDSSRYYQKICCPPDTAPQVRARPVRSAILLQVRRSALAGATIIDQ